MRYLITDPCYIVPKKDWDNFCDNFYDGSGIIPYTIAGFGVITDCQNTANGDGSVHISHGKDVHVDAGLVCLVELNDNITPTSYEGTAITDSKDTAQSWYETALQI